MVRRILVTLAIAVALVWAYSALKSSVRPTGTPQGQIRASLTEALDALQEGRTPAAMRVVAPDYKDSTGWNRDRLYLLARDAAQNKANWSATIQRLEPSVQGADATVPLRVSVYRSETRGPQMVDVTLTMRNDKVYAYGIIPTTRWRIVSASHIPFGMGDE